MNKKALFCDGTASYVIPAEPGPNESVVLRFRTARNDSQRLRLSRVVLGKESFKWSIPFPEGCSIIMRLHVSSEQNFFHIVLGFAVETPLLLQPMRCGGSVDKEMYHFQIMPGFSTPDWAKGAVMYQIFVDRFCNGDRRMMCWIESTFTVGAPVERVTDWNSMPSAMDVRRFYGGDLQGVMNKLDYICRNWGLK